MKEHRAIYLCTAILVGLWLADASFEKWSDARGRTRSAPLRMPLEQIPFSLGEWHGRSVELDPDVVKASQADQFIRRDYCNASGRVVGVYVTYYGGLYQGVPHGPKTCYPMAGWTIADDTLITGQDGKPDCRQFLFQKDLDAQLVLYWYYVNGVRLANESWTRLQFVSRILRGAGGSIVQVHLTASLDNTTIAAAQGTLSTFRHRFQNVLDAALPDPTASAPAASNGFERGPK